MMNYAIRNFSLCRSYVPAFFFLFSLQFILSKLLTNSLSDNNSDNKSIVDLICKYNDDRITISAIQCLQPSNSILLSVMKLLKTRRNINIKWIDRAHNRLAHDQARNAIAGLYEDTKSSILCSNLADGQISNIQSLFSKEEIFKLRIHRIHSTLIQ